MEIIEVSIDKNIPIPSRCRIDLIKYPFEKMVKGDSFEIEVTGSHEASKIYAALKYYNKRNNSTLKICTRYGGLSKKIRVWRIE